MNFASQRSTLQPSNDAGSTVLLVNYSLPRQYTACALHSLRSVTKRQTWSLGNIWLEAMCSLTPHHRSPSRFLTRITGLTAILVVGLCSIFYLTFFLPGFSVKSGLVRWVPKPSNKTEPQAHWDQSPRRLIVFGDSWSDNGLYPIDPPPEDQPPTREEAQGKAWTEWLCSAVWRLATSASKSYSQISRSHARTMTISQGRCLSRGIVDIAALSLIATFSTPR